MERLRIDIVLCRFCKKVLEVSSQSADSEEIENDSLCSPAFAGWVACPDHPAKGPDQGLSYSKEALPILWSVRIVNLPEVPV